MLDYPEFTMPLHCQLSKHIHLILCLCVSILPAVRACGAIFVTEDMPLEICCMCILTWLDGASSDQMGRHLNTSMVE